MSEELENIEELENTEELEEESQEEEEPIEPDDPEVIPLVYNYDANSFAFLYACNAERDRAESIVQEHYVPLVPAHATLIEIPTYEENEIPVFSEETQEWSVVADYR